jgi:hypothetical protein
MTSIVLRLCLAVAARKASFWYAYPSLTVVRLIIRDHVGCVAITRDAIAWQKGLCLDPGTGRLPHLFDCQIKTFCRFFVTVKLFL